MSRGRRHRPAIGAVAVALAAVALSGCDDGRGGATGSAACTPVEQPPRQEGSHLIGDAEPPVPYSSVPPSSGWHASGPPPVPGVYGATVPAPQLVNLLEQGGVAVTHARPLTPAETALAATLVDDLGQLVVTPWELAEDDQPFALVAWGVVQRCDELRGDDVAAFAAEHGGEDREG